MKTRIFLLLLIFQSNFLLTTPFWVETIKHPMQVGAIFECSPAVGNELVRFMKMHDGPRRILELGAGKGAMTRVICQNLRPDDQFDVIEINPSYCVDLSKQFDRTKFPNVKIHCTDALSFKTNVQYDFLICTIPLTTMPNGILALLLDHVKTLAHSGSFFSFVEYVGTFQLRYLLALGVNRTILKQRHAIIEEFKKRYHVRTEPVLKNVPPLRVYHLKF